MASLAVADEVEFALLKDAMGISDSLLSRKVSTLEKSGYLCIKKKFVAKRPRTWISLTVEGRRAFEEYIVLLKKIVK